MTNKILSALFIFFWIAGCQNTAKPTPQNPEVLSTANGYIFVEFPTSPYILSVKSVSNGKIFELQPDELNQVAGLWLPPDNYFLHEIRGNILLPTTEVFDLKGYPSFKIYQGEVTSLGALIDFRIGEGNALWIQRASKDSDARLKNWLSKNDRYLSSKIVNSWSVDSVPKPTGINFSGNGFLIDFLIKAESKSLDGNIESEILNSETVNALYESLLIKSNPQAHRNELGIVQIVSDSSGNQYFPAQLGQIKKRNKTGTWVSIDTGYSSSVKTLDVENDLILAGLASGQLIRSLNGGKTWEDIYRFEGLTITKIHKINEKIFVLAHSSSSKISYLYSSPLSEKINFIEIKRSQKETPFESMSQKNGNNLYFNLTNKSIFKFDAISLEIEEIPFPGDLINFYVNPIGEITIMSRSILGSLYLSDPTGKNWEEIDFPQMGKAYFISNTTGIAFAWGKVKEFDSKIDGWQINANFQDGCITALVDEEDLDLFCTDKRGNIFKYRNKIWIREGYIPSTM